MTYNDFLNTLVAPITYLISWCGMFFNYMITNYFYITILGLFLFSSLLFYFLDFILFNIKSHSKDLDNINHKGGDF